LFNGHPNGQNFETLKKCLDKTNFIPKINSFKLAILSLNHNWTYG
jgi:hypothetical protein